MSLRPYQELGIRKIGEAFGRGARAVCFVLATGGGKSRIPAEIIARHLKKNPLGKVLVTAHREELVGQLFDTFVAQGLSCGVIQATPCREVNAFREVQVASTQTLVARGIVVPGITLKLDDENHHQVSEKWSPVTLAYKNAGVPVIGFTATPIRGDGIGLGEVYDDLVCPISMRELIEQGYLTPYDLIAPPGPLRSGEIAQSPVDAYIEHAKGQKTAVFSGNIKAAEQHCKEFRDAGYDAEIITGQMDSGTRRAILKRYADGNLRILINVGVLVEGWDDPPTSCIILARGIGSIGLYLQIIGRGLRLSPGKTRCTILDLHGSSHSPGFGNPDDDREYSLDGEGIRSKGEIVNIRHCVGCGVTLEPDEAKCPLCNIAKPELTAPEVVNVKLVKFAAKRREDDLTRAKSLMRWIDDAKMKRHKPGAAFYKYAAVYGEKPTPEIMNTIKLLKKVAVELADPQGLLQNVPH